MGVLVANRYGSYGAKKPEPEKNNWDSLSIDESLVPFVSAMDSDRLILARTHMGQKIPIANAEQALVETGAEYIVPQIVSSKFASTAKYNGEVISVVPKESVTVKYENGSIEVFDILPRFSSTKRNSTIMMEMESLQKGDKFKKSQLIAWTKMFDGTRFVGGRNITIALMNYNGLSYEDGYVVSNRESNKFVSDVVKKITVLVPPDVKVLKFNSEIYKKTEKDEVLLEFQYADEIEKYIETYGLLDANPDPEGEEDDTSFSKGNETIKTLSPGGEIVNIKIKINNPKKTDNIILQKWKTMVTDIKRKHKELTKYAQSQKESLIDNIDMSILKTGIHKHKGNIVDGTIIEFYVRTPHALQKGDKMSNRFGAKGVVNHVMTEEENPKAEFSGNIDIFLPAVGVLGRKNTAVVKELYIGKIILNLQNIIKEKIRKNEQIQDVKSFILKIYDILDPTKDKRLVESIKTKINISDKEFKNLILSDGIFFNYIIPPFNVPSFENINEAAETLGIELNERVYIPELGTYTKTKVPVGVAYYSCMEQYADDYANVRSQGGYNASTGQPLKGASRLGGQAIGGLDLFALLSFDSIPVLQELMTMRSDNVSLKRKMLNNLRLTGSSGIVKDDNSGQTKLLFRIYFKSMGLDIVD